MKENQKQSVQTDKQKVSFLDGEQPMSSITSNAVQAPVIEEEGMIFRPFNMKENKQLEEKNLKKHLQMYFDQLDENLKSSFAPLDTLLKDVFKGYDPHFLLAVSKVDSKPRGLLVFNLDSNADVNA